MEKIVFLDRDTIAPQIHIPKPNFEHEWQEFGNTEPNEVIERLQNASIVITNKVVLDREKLSQLPNIKYISVAATGYNCVDLDYCKENNIVVSNIRGYANNTVPEHVFALILSLKRNLIEYRNQLQNGAWQESGMFCFYNRPIHDLAGSNMVIFGSGNLGQKVASIAKVFDMNVYFSERKSKTTAREGYILWQEALEIADVISLHCPLTEETKNMIDLQAFQKMQRKPVLINTARGGLVNENDLKVALENNLISGAGFDVSVKEPPEKDSVLMQLVDRIDFILTPHTAWASDEAVQILVNQLIDNMQKNMKGIDANRLV